MQAPTRPDWALPAALTALAAIPVIAGIVRLIGLAGGGDPMPDDARFIADPAPVVAHVVGSSLFAVAGAFQLSAATHRRRPRWHRFAGRILAPAGLVAACSGLWLTAFFPAADNDGPLLALFRVMAGSTMVFGLVFGVIAIARRDVPRHRAWMLRSYAIGLGAGTQAFVIIPWVVLVGPPGELARALLMGAGWAINLAVAEWVVRARPLGDSRRASDASAAQRPERRGAVAPRAAG